MSEESAHRRRAEVRTMLNQALAKKKEAEDEIARLERPLDEAHAALAQKYMAELSAFDLPDDQVRQVASNRVQREHQEWLGMVGESAEDYQ